MCFFLHDGVPKQFFLNNYLIIYFPWGCCYVAIAQRCHRDVLVSLLFWNNALYEFLMCFPGPSSPQIKDPDSQSIPQLNSLLGYISTLFFIRCCTLKWKSLLLEKHITGKMTSEMILFSWVRITASLHRGWRGFKDFDEWSNAWASWYERKFLKTINSQARSNWTFGKG